MKANNLGPQRAYEALAAYMKAEQKLGRISSKARPLGAAALLLGACYHHAFFQHLLDPDVVPIDNESFPAEAVRALLEGLVVRS
jgi:hypothetical protein